MRFRLLLWAALVCFGAWSSTAAAQDKFELKDGDRVVFLGNTLIEREQKYGYWELMLTMAWPERNVTFRNLGWSGDTVWGESRAGFGSQADGFKKLVEEVNAAKPTVIFVGYGNVEAFDGEKGLPKFVEGFGKLLDELEKTKARIVILGPTKMEPSMAVSKNSESYNKKVDAYSAALLGLATQRGHRFVDLAGATGETVAGIGVGERARRSVNGIDFTGHGYRDLAATLEKQLRLPGILGQLPLIGDNDDVAGESAPIVLTIQEKNELFFHRWRPQNETYLFGFRKHEQGKNAAEVFQFDPLVEAEEKKIAELRLKLAAEMKNGGAK